MALSELNFSDNVSIGLTAKTAAPFTDAQSPTFKVDIQKPAISLKKTVANAEAGGADLAYSALLSIAGGGNTTIDLQNFTNIAGQASASFARVKFVMFRLLSTEDDAANGSACSGITIEPDASNGWTSLIAAAGDKLKLENGDVFKWATRSAGGKAVGASNKVIKITNTDGSVAAKVQVVIVGGSS